MTSALLHRFRDDLQDTSPAVWSLLVTVFGDMVQHDGAQISGQAVTQLMTELDVRPEATRVALHRLRKDGWITSHKDGRRTNYRLSDRGLAETRAVTPRIYSADQAAETAWLVIPDPAAPRDDPASVALTPQIAVTPAAPRRGSTFATRLDGPLPDWMSARLCDDGQITRCAALADATDWLLAQTLSEMEPVHSAALRVLLVHSWRRIVLKTPPLPDHLFPHGWQGKRARANVAQLLTRLRKPDPAELTDAAIA